MYNQIIINEISIKQVFINNLYIFFHNFFFTKIVKNVVYFHKQKIIDENSKIKLTQVNN